MPATITPNGLRTRWAVARLHCAAGRMEESGRAGRPVRAMGLSFPTPIGLAAGFDRHGRLLDRAQRLGLGAVELGTLAVASDSAVLPPRRPRRLPGDAAVRRGLSIGKPPGLSWEHAEAPYLRALRAAHAGADYLTLNPGRDCPSPARFAEVVAAVVRARDRLARPRPLPIVVKLPARWLDGNEHERIAAAFVAGGADGLLVSAEGERSRADAHACLKNLSDALGPRVCLISVGGVDSVREAQARLRAGATLVQIHRALLTHAPQLLRALRRPLVLHRPFR